MSPRPRTLPDAAILAATARVIARHGPARLTLAQVAADVGLVPATLVQRFGSRRGLLLALARQGRDAASAELEALRRAHRRPLAALLALPALLAGMAESPTALAHHLAFLALDLTDPEFHAHAEAMFATRRRAIERLLREAVHAGELTPGDTARLAGAVEAVLNGSLLTWAIHRRGPVERWMRRDLEAVLAGRRPQSRATARRSQGSSPKAGRASTKVSRK